MSKNAERILWSVLLLALGVSLFLIFSPAGKILVSGTALLNMSINKKGAAIAAPFSWVYTF